MLICYERKESLKIYQPPALKNVKEKYYEALGKVSFNPPIYLSWNRITEMAFIEVNLSMPGRRKINDVGRSVTSPIILSNEKGIKCALMPPGLVIKGDMGILLEILDELDNDSFRKISNKVSFTIESDEIYDRSLPRLD